MALATLLRPLLVSTAIFSQSPSAVVIEPDENPSAVVLTAAPQPETASSVEISTRAKQEQVLIRLRVQTAIRDAKALLAEQRYGEAIDVLEPMLESAATSEPVLPLLEDAYRGQMARMLEERQVDQARLYAERLRVLAPRGGTRNAPEATPSEPVTRRRLAGPVVEPSAAPAERLPAVSPGSAERGTTISDAKPSSLQASLVAAPNALARLLGGKSQTPSSDRRDTKRDPGARPAYEARGQMSETEPATQPPAAAADPGGPNTAFPSAVAQAESLFESRQYAKALPLYEKAYDADPHAVQSYRDHWGYCLLFVAVERYNRWISLPADEVSLEMWDELEADVRTARSLAPSLDSDFVSKALASIETQRKHARRSSQPRPEVQGVASTEKVKRYTGTSLRDVPAVSLRHLPAQNASWAVAETENFRIHHRDRQLAERVAKLAEAARLRAHRLWFADEPLDPWRPRCDLYLFPTAAEYHRTTNVGAQSPGHTKVLNDRGRIATRQLFLRVDDPSALTAVLPHEVAHIVFAGRFGIHNVPRWADEGMAVLTEPADKQQAHLRNLASLRGGLSLRCSQLMLMGEYPPGPQMRDFYAQSVGLCRFLVDKGGEGSLVNFLRQALPTGDYETALRSVYGMSGFTELEGEYHRFVSSLQNGKPTLAQARGLDAAAASR